MPEALRKPFKIQGAKTTKAAFQYSVAASILVRLYYFGQRKIPIKK
jgi:hypothetical protein